MVLVASPLPEGTISGQIHVRGETSPAGITVYLDKAPMVAGDFTKGHFVIDLKNDTFSKQSISVPVGSTVQFANHGRVPHHIFSLSRSKPFDLSIEDPGKTKSVTFDQPGIVKVQCAINTEMITHILVLRNPYIAITDASGHYTIPDPNWTKTAGLPTLPALPIGNYTVKIWLSKLRSTSRSVNIPTRGTITLDLSTKRDPLENVQFD